MTTTDRVCTIEGCARPHFGRGWCEMHYWRWRRHGDPLAVTLPKRTPIAERLWAQVDRSGGPDACWPWTGRSVHVFGYGIIWDADLGHVDGAHRVAYRLTYGELPDDSPAVRHTCDNPPCCNPAHLVAGTQIENMEDMDARQRRRVGDRKGEANNAAKLTDADVRTIRELRKQGIGPTELAARFGVNRSTVKQIVRGRTWKHVT